MKKLIFPVSIAFLTSLLFIQFSVTNAVCMEYQPMSLARKISVPGEMRLPDQTSLQPAILKGFSINGLGFARSEYASQQHRFFLENNQHFLPVSKCLNFLVVREGGEINPYVEVIGGFDDNNLYMHCIIFVEETGITEFSNSPNGVPSINHIPASKSFAITKMAR